MDELGGEDVELEAVRLTPVKVAARVIGVLRPMKVLRGISCCQLGDAWWEECGGGVGCGVRTLMRVVGDVARCYRVARSGGVRLPCAECAILSGNRMGSRARKRKAYIGRCKLETETRDAVGGGSRGP